jgi:hypothetical protein
MPVYQTVLTVTIEAASEAEACDMIDRFINVPLPFALEADYDMVEELAMDEEA